MLTLSVAGSLILLCSWSEEVHAQEDQGGDDKGNQAINDEPELHVVKLEQGGKGIHEIPNITPGGFDYQRE